MIFFFFKNVEWLAYVYRYEQTKFVCSITEDISLHLDYNLVGLIVFVAFHTLQVLNL